MANLAAKYRPKTFDDVVEQKVVVNIVRNICESKTMSNRNFLFVGGAGCGKAQPLYSKVLTPDGFITMGEVSVGTRVITRTGEVASVSHVFPQGERPIYRITLQDKTYIDVADNHLNLVYYYDQGKKEKVELVVDTLELIKLLDECRYKLRIEMMPSIDVFNSTESLPVDPYLLGVLLGDGSLAGSFGFSSTEQDVIDAVNAILDRDYHYRLRPVRGSSCDWTISPVTPYKYLLEYNGDQYTSVAAVIQELCRQGYPKFDPQTIHAIIADDAPKTLARYPELKGSIQLIETNADYRVNKLQIQLSELGVCVKSTEKHIPQSYLIASASDRLRLLQGLIDTDGYTDKGGNVDFTTSSPQMSEDFAYLVQSLGIRDTVTVHPSSYVNSEGNRVSCSLSYTHYLHIPNGLKYCTSNKHMSRYHDRQHPPIRNIVSIDYIGDMECQCIYVDHPDHTYISDNFIPTHNTTLGRLIANELNEHKGGVIEIDAASHSGVEDMRQIVEQANQYPVGTNYKVFIVDECHTLSPSAWQSALKTIEEQPAKSVFIWCTTNPEKIPATILSRVQTFQLSKISLDGIYNRLIHIIEEENKEGREITYEEDAVRYISRLAQGGMRDAITLLDKSLAYSTNITSQTIQEALGLPNYDDYFAMLNAIVKKQNEDIVKIINSVYNSGVNFIRWFEGFFSFTTNIVKYIYMQDISQTMIPATYQDKIQGYGPTHAMLCLKLSNVLVKLIQELKGSQYLQELAISYLCSSQKG